MKKFVRVEQVFYNDVIMDIDDNESNEEILKRVMHHLKTNGIENVICMGGNINCDVIDNVKPTDGDEDRFECID